jgi:hypothetical protein
MRTLRLFVFFSAVLALIFCLKCSRDTGNEPLAPGSFDPASVTFTHSMKGWELYSWPDGNNWNFAILAGTNRVKTYEEVKSNRITVTGTDSLKMLLDRFPENENIFWIGEGWLKNCWHGFYGNLSLPAAETISEIRNFCLQKNLVLNISN